MIADEGTVYSASTTVCGRRGVLWSPNRSSWRYSRRLATALGLERRSSEPEPHVHAAVAESLRFSHGEGPCRVLVVAAIPSVVEQSDLVEQEH